MQQTTQMFRDTTMKRINKNCLVFQLFLLLHSSSVYRLSCTPKCLLAAFFAQIY